MLNNLTLKFTENEDLNFSTEGITIFVGPNSSGKSLALREINQTHTDIVFHEKNYKLVKDYEISWPNPEDLKEQAAQIVEDQAQHISFQKFNQASNLEAQTFYMPDLLRELQAKNKSYILSQYSRWGVITLDGKTRFTLTDDRTGGDLQGQPQNLLAHLFKNDSARQEVRKIIYDAIGLYFVIDPTNLGSLRIRLATQPPGEDEQSLNSSARDFHKNALHIKDASDGIQAFAGIITVLFSSKYHTILIDEPEAFLHPPLARKLGKNLSTLTNKNKGALFASTHSPDFLMGCLQGESSTRVIRMEFSNGKSRGRMVDTNELEKLFVHPLMRNTNVISALFHDGVIVTESDNDRVFYSEIYHRLSEAHPDFPSILFLNAQNKQTIKDILRPLRLFGVPAAAIPDIDIVKDGGRIWTDWLKAIQIPDALHISYGEQRSSIKAKFLESGKDMKTDGGIKILEGSNRHAAEHFFKTLGEYGLFVVQGGELENWLPHLKVEGKKTDWTINMLTRLGSDPASADYVKPAEDDVWAFMKEIVQWIKNTSRSGTL